MVRTLIAAVILLPCLVLLLPVFVVAGGMFLFAWCVQALGRLIEPRFVPWPDLIEFDQYIGWRPRADVDAYYLVDRDDVFRVVTDHDGWPGKGAVEESAVVVIGDSFAFGYGVDAGSSFADLIPGVSVKALGAPGYSMVHGVLLIEQLGARLAGKLVVWFVCLENDLQDNLAPAMMRYRSPFVRFSAATGNWEIATDHVRPTPWPSTDHGWKRILPHLCVPGPIADRAYGACDYLIGQAAASCSRIGAQLILVTVPDPSQLTAGGRARLKALGGNSPDFDANLPDRRIVASCIQHGVPAIVGKEHLSVGDYKRIEALHWNQRGHRRIAEIIGRSYQSFRMGTLQGSAAMTPQVPGDSGVAAPPNRSSTHDEPSISIGAV